MSKKNIIISVIKYILLVGSAILCQTALFGGFGFFEIKPDIVCATVLLVTVFDGVNLGALYALICSFLVMGIGERTFSLSPIFYVGYALVSHLLYEKFDRRNRFSAFFVISLLFSLVNSLKTFIHIIASWKEYLLQDVFLSLLLPEFLATFILSLVLYPLFLLLFGKREK